MAQDITLLNAQYSAVPAVELPKTGGGTATFTDTSDADATASKIVSPNTAYVNGEKITGSIQTQTTVTVSGNKVTARAGYYPIAVAGTVASGSVTMPSSISGSSATVSTGTNTLTLTKSVNATPTVTTEGYVTSGTLGSSSVSLTASVTTKGAHTYTPTTSDQEIAGSQYLTGRQLIKGDANLVAGNIKSGTEIFGVTGTYTGSSNLVTGTFTTSSSSGVQSVTIPYTGTGYPIAGLVYIDGGVYNSNESAGGNTAWYNSMQRYAVGEWAYTKTRVPTAPNWGTSGVANAGVIAVIYKNSTSNNTSYSRTSAMSVVVLTSNDPTSTATEVIKFSDNKTMKVYIASSSYGLIASTKYAYHIIYSS